MRILLRAPQPAATLGASVSVANRTYHELNCRNEEHLAQLQRRVEAAVERLCPERFHYWNVPSHSLYDAGRFFDADETEWLRRVKDAYDPSDLFRVRNGIWSSSGGRSCDSEGEEEGGGGGGVWSLSTGRVASLASREPSAMDGHARHGCALLWRHATWLPP